MILEKKEKFRKKLKIIVILRMRMSILLTLLVLCSCEAASVNKDAKNYAKEIANEVMGVKIAIEHAKATRHYVDPKTCMNTTYEQCQLCKAKIVEDDQFCRKPEGNVAKCLCFASKHNWRTYFENVEDKLQTVEEACDFVCKDAKPRNESVVVVPDNATN